MPDRRSEPPIVEPLWLASHIPWSIDSIQNSLLLSPLPISGGAPVTGGVAGSTLTARSMATRDGSACHRRGRWPSQRQ